VTGVFRVFPLRLTRHGCLQRFQTDPVLSLDHPALVVFNDATVHGAGPYAHVAMTTEGRPHASLKSLLECYYDPGDVVGLTGRLKVSLPFPEVTHHISDDAGSDDGMGGSRPDSHSGSSFGSPR
jgi:hypothetical protein